MDVFVQSRQEYLDLVKAAILLPVRHTDLQLSRLSIITFNFDRSFEWRLFEAIRGRYGVAPGLASALCEHVPVLHAHGMMGAPSWRANVRDGLDYGANLTAGDLRRRKDNIKIVHRGDPDLLRNDIRRRLQECGRTYFLGFGYHPLNLEKLGVPTVLNHPAWGTGFRLPDGEREQVKARFRTEQGEQRIYVDPNNIVNLLRMRINELDDE